MKRMIIAAASAAVVATAAVPAMSSVSDLVAFLERAERMFGVNRTLRASVTTTGTDGATVEAVLILDPGGRQFFSAKAAGWRSMTPLSWTSQGEVVERTGAAARPISVDERLAGTDLRGIDFFPFWKTDYTTAFISDESRSEKTVSLFAAKERPYTLYVISFDKEKLVPRVVKYYRESFSNMVRIRTDTDHVMVGGRPRPTTIVVRDFTENTNRTYKLEWTELDQAPTDLTSWSGD